MPFRAVRGGEPIDEMFRLRQGLFRPPTLPRVIAPTNAAAARSPTRLAGLTRLRPPGPIPLGRLLPASAFARPVTPAPPRMPQAPATPRLPLADLEALAQRPRTLLG